MISSTDLSADAWSQDLAGVRDVITAQTLVADYVTIGGITLVVGFLVHCALHARFQSGVRRAARVSDGLTLGIMADLDFRRALKEVNQQLWDWSLPGIPHLLSCTVDRSGMVFRNMRGEVLARLPAAALRVLEPGERSVRLAVRTSGNQSREAVLTFQPRTISLLHSSLQNSPELEVTAGELQRLLNENDPPPR